MVSVKLFNDDCFKVLPQLIQDNVKVNLVLTDLPYNETGNRWETDFNLQLMFEYLNELIADDGAILLHGSLKFGVKLINACPDLYKYEWVWMKEHGSNIPSVNYQPFRVHEYIFVFGKGRVSYGKRTPMKYYPQKTKGKPYSCYNQGNNFKGMLKRIKTVNSGDRHPLTIQFFKRDRGFHPTQKPVELLEYLIKTYTDEDDLVLDFTMGSGSTGVACKNTGRNFIGVELDDEYFSIAKNRISNSQSKLI